VLSHSARNSIGHQHVKWHCSIMLPYQLPPACIAYGLRATPPARASLPPPTHYTHAPSTPPGCPLTEVVKHQLH
jgi:hypothetical protein